MRGLQASSSSTRASQTGPAWVTSIFALVGGTANNSNHGFQACLRGWQTTLSSSQAPQARECMGCKHPLPRAVIAGLAKRGLHASLPSPQAPQTLQIMGCRHACVGCRHACVGRRHRKHCKSRVQACLPVWSFKILKRERGGERVSGWGVCSIVSTTCL